MPKIPIGLELVKRGILTDKDVKKALEYQILHPGMRLVDIKPEDITIPLTEYYPLDIAKITKAIPFAVNNGRLRVAFSRPNDEESLKKIRLLALRKRAYIRTIFHI